MAVFWHNSGLKLRLTTFAARGMGPLTSTGRNELSYFRNRLTTRGESGLDGRSKVSSKAGSKQVAVRLHSRRFWPRGINGRGLRE